MDTIQIITKNENDRRTLKQIFSNMGKNVVFSYDLNDALDIFEKARPNAVFMVDEEEPPVNIKLREIQRIAPFIPMVVLLKKRDSSHAIEYMKLGAFDCAHAPWTEEQLRPIVKKSLNLSGTTIELEKPDFKKQKIAILITAALLTIMFGFIFGWRYAYNKYYVIPAQQDKTELPYLHPSGIVFNGEEILISDWYTQAIYKHNPIDLKISGVHSFPDITPIALTSGENNLWLANAQGMIEKRLKDAKFTPLSKTSSKATNLIGMCFDGLYFWTADAASGKLTKHLNNDNLDKLESFNYPGKNLSAMTCDTRFIWIADGKLKELIKMPLDNPEKVLARKVIKEYSSKTLKITGLTKKNEKIWFVAEDGKKGLLFSIMDSAENEKSKNP
ncbi:MAG: hypothetical protein KKD35_05765 [Elusimicrobia bacterium]|nr:hypothetical protein [Elusimicrobiota bacterium]